ncbi:MAG TPA: hypothetical protein VFZ66_22710 [Herpetosiphonaceae bacterium]
MDTHLYISWLSSRADTQRALNEYERSDSTPVTVIELLLGMLVGIAFVASLWLLVVLAVMLFR